MCALQRFSAVKKTVIHNNIVYTKSVVRLKAQLEFGRD